MASSTHDVSGATPVFLGALPTLAERLASGVCGRVEVRPIDLADTPDDAVVERVVAALAEFRGARFVLGGEGAEFEVVARVVERLLSGEAPVFGLAGVVLAHPTGSAATMFDLPALAWGVAADERSQFSPCVTETPENGPERASADRIGGVMNGSVAAVFLRARFSAADDLGEAIDGFVEREIDPSPAVPDDWARLIASDRTDVEVRSILARRALPDDAEYVPKVMDAAQLALLREIAALVVPQDAPAIDLAARVDAQLSRGEGDGWRNATLPPDPEAYRAGLATLAPRWAGENTLRAAIEGKFESDGPLDSAQVAVWLEDVRVDLVRQWLAHPAIAARAGFDGFATGGTVLPLRGFTDLGGGRREAWEPAGVNA